MGEEGGDLGAIRERMKVGGGVEARTEVELEEREGGLTRGERKEEGLVGGGEDGGGGNIGDC